jgi:hypothetical protein
MLLAFSAKPEELDILMLSLTFGNVEVQKYVAIGIQAWIWNTWGPHLQPFTSQITLWECMD